MRERSAWRATTGGGEPKPADFACGILGAGKELRDFTSYDLGLVGRHKCVGIIDLDDAGVGKDLGSALRMFQRKEPVVSGPQQQHGSVVTAQLLCGAGVFGVDGAKKADRVTADSSIGSGMAIHIHRSRSR
jgi:hypothetical protein